MVNLRTKADSIEIDSDEFGWYMQVDTEDGDCFVVRLDMEQALDLAQKQTSRIREWWAEGQVAAASHQRELDIKDSASEGYSLDDPKHPTYYDRMVGDS